MRRLGQPRGVRTRLLLATVVSVGLAVAILVTAFNVLLDRRLSADADSVLRDRATAELGALRVERGALSVAEAPDAAAAGVPVWVFAGRRAVETPPAAARASAMALAMAGGGSGFRDVPAADMRLFALPVVQRGRRLGTVVAGESVAAYEDTRQTALAASVLLGAALLVLTAASTAWMLRRALRPVARMTADAAEWGAHDVERRFQLGPPHDELTQLGATLDGLLTRIGAALRREERVTEEISHELRTPLARIAAEAELALRRARPDAEYRAALARIRQNAEGLTRIVETLMQTARQHAPGATGSCDPREAVLAAVSACAPLAGERDVHIAVEPGRGVLRAGVDQAVAERIVQPLLENASRFARTAVVVGVGRAGGAIAITIADDGPGVALDRREAIFEAGVGDGAGAGLGLALARRLARAADGDVAMSGNGPGATFRITLPAG